MSYSGRGLLGELSSSRARVTPIKLRRRPLTWIHFPSLLLRHCPPPTYNGSPLLTVWASESWKFTANLANFTLDRQTK